MLPTRVLEVVTIAAAGVALLAVLLALRLARRVGQLWTSVDALAPSGERGAFVQAVERQQAASEGLRGDLKRLREDMARERANGVGGLRHVAVVRYDALSDMGGRLSFSAALLDDAGNGMVLTSINGRTETRTFAKGVRGGASEHTLSPEEQQAIGHALNGERPTYDEEDEPAVLVRRGRGRA